MTDDRPRQLEPDAAGDLPLAELVKTAADAVDVGRPEDYNPSAGRVLDDSQTDTGDVFDVRLANLGSTADITVGELTAKITT